MKLYYLLILLLAYGCSSDLDVEHEGAQDNSDVLKEENLSSGLIWHYENDFEEKQKAIYEKWITDVHEACAIVLGEYPFDMNVHFHESENKTVPVSFGHTRRNEFNELHFYVNPSCTYEELIQDWTAQHEMSHLSIPFVGKKYQWFSEGYATYMSRRIMIYQGFYTESSFDSLYLSNIIDKKGYYTNEEMSFSEASADLFKRHIYGPVYWAGAGFFYRADKLLQSEHDMRMTDVIKEYQTCCRTTDKNYKSVIRSFDKIIDSDLFAKLSDQYENDPCTEVMAEFN